MPIILAILLLCAGNCYAAPSISSVSGAAVAGQQITISGSSFGSTGPTIRIFDDFERGADGESISLTGCPVGVWSSANAYNPVYDDLSWSAGSTPHGALSFQIGHLPSTVSTEMFRQLKLDFSSSDEVFISYCFMVPDGSTFPQYGEVLAEETLPSVSVWKQTWLMENDQTSGNDICIPTKSSASEWKIQGNSGLIDLTGPETGSGDNPDLMTTAWPTPPGWFHWDKWTRISIWIKTNTADPYTWTSITQVQMLGEGYGITNYNYTDVKTLNDVMGWTDLNFPGWMRIPDDDTDSLTVRPVYDDIYVALGASSAARVELGDNATYANCTNLSIAIATSWADGEITATINQGSFENGTAYLFVVDADGAVSGGYPVTFIDQASPISTGCMPILN
jgi:hypothetical protein